MQNLNIAQLLIIVGGIIIALIILVPIVLKILEKRIGQIKFKDLEIDFNNFEKVKDKGESASTELFRSLLLKQLLFTQEFVNRFQPLIATFVRVSKKWDMNIIETKQEVKYPSLKHSKESLERFRDILRNTKFDYVINWDCPIYDKVNSGYRQSYIDSLGTENKLNITIPNLIEDCTKQIPSIDIQEHNVLSGYDKINELTNRYINELSEMIENGTTNDSSSVEKDNDIHKLMNLKNCIKELNTYIFEQYDRLEVLKNRFDYAMDMGNTMYESLLFWNEKLPCIEQSETSAILYIIYQNLSLWLIRNDLPLSQVKLDQYLDTHAPNLVSKINEEVIKQMPRFEQKMWEESLKEIGISDNNINNFFRDNLKRWIIGVQQVRFGKNIFIGTEDYEG